MAAITPAPAMASDQNRRAWPSSATIPSSMAVRTSSGAATLPTVQRMPTTTPAVMPFHWARMVSPMSFHPSRLERESSTEDSTMTPNLPSDPEPH